MTRNISILLFLMSVSFSAVCYSQWSSDMRLTFSPDSSATSWNKRCIAVSGNFVHIVWIDSRDGDLEIYYKQSTNSGTDWGSDFRISNALGVSSLPVIAVSGSYVHIIWNDKRLNNQQDIYYRRSSDNGITWSNEIRITTDPLNSSYASVNTSGSFVFLAWNDNRDGNYEIYCAKSSDNGLTFGSEMRLTNEPAMSTSPSNCIFGQYIQLVWNDNRDGNYEIYYKKSTDLGNTWSNDIRLTNSPGSSLNSTISNSGPVVHLAWMDFRDNNYEIYYKRSTDNGQNWEGDVRMTDNASYSSKPFILSAGSNVHLVWADRIEVPLEEIFYRRSTSEGLTWEPLTRLIYDPGLSEGPSLAVWEQKLHLVWFDDRDGNPEIYYKNNPTGNPVGIQKISSEVPSNSNLLQNYPNPFNPVTTIKFDVPLWRGAGGWNNVKLTVFDLLGREAAVLVYENLEPGTYSVKFDGCSLNSGVYFYKLTAGNFTAVKKMVLIK